jgi:hypothetical protein
MIVLPKRLLLSLESTLKLKGSKQVDTQAHLHHVMPGLAKLTMVKKIFPA